MNTFTDDSARRIANVVRRVESERPDRGAEGTFASRMIPAFWGVITQCQMTAGSGQGFCKVRETEGPLSASPISGSPELLAWLGLDPWHRVGDVVLVQPCRGKAQGVTFIWSVEQNIEGAAHWAPPTQAELAATQDAPAAASFCTNMVNPNT